MNDLIDRKEAMDCITNAKPTTLKGRIAEIKKVDAIPVKWLEEWCRVHNKVMMYYLMMSEWERTNKDA